MNNTHLTRTAYLMLLLLITGRAIYAQKVAINGDTIYKDGTHYALLKRTGEGLGTGFRLYTLGGIELAKIENRTLPGKPKPGQTTSTVNYQMVEFLGTEFSIGCEIQKHGKRELAELIVLHDLVNGEKLNASAVFRFCEKFGYPYTKVEKNKTPKQN